MSPLLLANDRWKVTGEKIGDRYGHRIEIHFQGAWHPLLCSQEGNDDQPWPPSPPMQQLVLESIGSSQEKALLGVGLAGSSHWSMTIDWVNKNSLRIDVACRFSEPPVWLGSVYTHASSSALHCDLETRTIHFQGHPIASWNSLHGAKCLSLGDAFQILPCMAMEPTRLRSQTVRWGCLFENLSTFL